MVINNKLFPIALRYLKICKNYKYKNFISYDILNEHFKNCEMTEDSFFVSFHLINFIDGGHYSDLDITNFVKFANRCLAELFINYILRVYSYHPYKSKVELNRDELIDDIVFYVKNSNVLDYSIYINNCISILKSRTRLNIDNHYLKYFLNFGINDK